MKNGQYVAEFEKAFAEYVGAKYAIALCNGTATLHTALVALGVKPGDKVAVPPLTMSATTIAVLQAGAVPVFVDVDSPTWLMAHRDGPYAIPVSLYGLHFPGMSGGVIDDAAQTLRPHGPHAFTSYSFQASKILALGEGGMLVTNDEELATKARSFSSLGYRLDPKSPRIDPAILKSPDYERHHTYPAFNYRMSDIVAQHGFAKLTSADRLCCERGEVAYEYQQAIRDCNWIAPQYRPEGWGHSYWCYAIALKDKSLWKPFTDSIVRNGGEMPYGAWRLTYQEPAFRRTASCICRRPPGGWPGDRIEDPNCPIHAEGATASGLCPIAEDLQPRLVQFQTNDLASAERNARALKKAIQELESVSHKQEWKMFDGTISGTPCE